MYFRKLVVTGLQYHTNNADFTWIMIHVKSELYVADITWQLKSEIGEPRRRFTHVESALRVADITWQLKSEF